MSSDNNEAGTQLALVPRTPMFQPYLTGGGGGYNGPYAFYPYPGDFGPLPQQGVYPTGVMTMPQGPGMTSSTADLGGMGACGARGSISPAAVKYQPPERFSGGGGGRSSLKRPSEVIMEHPTLRQLVILMAVFFVLALVAVIVTSIYMGRVSETPWNL
ncbi:hypothetical protein ACOMHN_033823 [Nucella lapillus]